MSVKLRARVVFEVEYDADPNDYALPEDQPISPAKMAEIDRSQWAEDPDAFIAMFDWIGEHAEGRAVVVVTPAEREGRVGLLSCNGSGGTVCWTDGESRGRTQASIFAEHFRLVDDVPEGGDDRG